MLAFERSTLPWTGTPVNRLLEGRALLARLCGGGLDELLPDRVELLFGLEQGPGDIRAHVEAVAAQLTREMLVWRARLNELHETGRIDRKALARASAALRGAQTWYVLHTAAGGLTDGVPMEGQGDPDAEAAGVIPCSAATHHGVAWWTEAGRRSVALVTSRRVGGHWNWDEDIGHEAAHASFGPVPLYSQSLEAVGFRTRLADTDARCIGEFAPDVVARITYVISEVIVAYIRGEQRTTGTGLPGLHSEADFVSFCDLAHRLLPSAGFDLAKTAGLQEGMPLAVWSGPTVRALGAAAFKAADVMTPLVNRSRPPTLDEVAAAAA